MSERKWIITQPHDHVFGNQKFKRTKWLQTISRLFLDFEENLYPQRENVVCSLKKCVWGRNGQNGHAKWKIIYGNLWPLLKGISLLAGVDVDGFDARFTLDVATPVKLALAPFLDGRLVRVVTPSAAHQVTSVHSGRRPVTRSTVCTWKIVHQMTITSTSSNSETAQLLTEWSDGFVADAVIRRFVQVNQVVGCG